MPLHLKERFQSYIGPYQFIASAAPWFLQVFKQGVPPQTSRQDQAFAKWFQASAHFMTAYEATTSGPSLVAACRGTVLELGPAIGNQLGYFTMPNIEHIYGIEPNGLFMDNLRTRIVKEDLEGRYTSIVGGVEDLDILAAHGVTEGSLDTVLSIQVLCSVRDPAEAARAIYALLKEGGELIFWEHHSSDDWVTWAVQKLWNTIWPIAVGGCRLDRPILDIIMKSGKWEVVELEGDGEPWVMRPRTWGRLRKATKSLP